MRIVAKVICGVRPSHGSRLRISYRIAGLMFLNLEPEEIVNSISRLLIRRCNSQLSAVWQILGRVLELIFEPLHPICARGCLGVDGRRRSEISLLEHSFDFRYVLPDCVSTGDVSRIIGGNFNDSAVREQFEMMRRLCLIKAHNLIYASGVWI